MKLLAHIGNLNAIAVGNSVDQLPFSYLILFHPTRSLFVKWTVRPQHLFRKTIKNLRLDTGGVCITSNPMTSCFTLLHLSMANFSIFSCTPFPHHHQLWRLFLFVLPVAVQLIPIASLRNHIILCHLQVLLIVFRLLFSP
jgi:hypothetical protein